MQVYSLYRVTVPEDIEPLVWAKAKADWYGFEYDETKNQKPYVWVWATHSDNEMLRAFERDHIDSMEFRISNLVAFFGL